MQAYYERRATEYDDWYLGTGLFADRERPGWEDELAAVQAAVRGLRPCRTLDVACGTGFVTRDLPGPAVALDTSPAMLRVARSRIVGPVVNGDGRSHPDRAGGVERGWTGDF
jgi:ubiquinone/menaquinone biosynthesis C-methylase UbiE